MGVTILSICSSWGDNIDNIVTPRETYTKIHSYLYTNERLSNVHQAYLVNKQDYFGHGVFRRLSLTLFGGGYFYPLVIFGSDFVN